MALCNNQYVDHALYCFTVNSVINRKTPCAAGCWGPKFNVKFLIVVNVVIFKTIII